MAFHDVSHLGPGARDLRRLRPALRRWSRSPKAYWFGVVVVSLTAGALTWNWLHRAETLAQRWGATRTVLVATVVIAAGAPIDGSVTTTRTLPVAALADDALTDLPSGSQAAVRLGAGTVLTAGAIDDHVGSPLARRLGPDRRAVSVVADDVALPVEADDRVVVYSAADGVSATIVTGDATVVGADDRVVTLSVPTDDAAAALEAISAGSLQLALVGRDP